MTKRKMPVWVKKWIEKLRSGDYKQGKYALCNLDNKFCCLGVLAHQRRMKIHKATRDHGYHNDKIYSELDCILRRQGLDKEDLTTLNDGGKSFKGIAKFIEANYK